jgi:hypothetical protein
MRWALSVRSRTAATSRQATRRLFSSHSARRSGFMLWERVRNLEPGGFRSDEDVFSRAYAWIGVERPQRYLAQSSVLRKTETRTADSTERPAAGRRTFIDNQEILARQPAKVLGGNLAVGRECRTMKSSTHRTVAVADFGNWPADRVANSAAQASARKIHCAHVLTRSSAPTMRGCRAQAYACRTMSTEISTAGTAPRFSSQCVVFLSSGQPTPGP